ncbi:hypothetical protein KOR34_52270 [Posidoniimonas corsicana]|uniref:Uncharacterized protein n=1 Tax=Posidoniimonas corsicana TaxID=1938618 RepID=A0A5C5UUH6_9BACT|nr:hypothetical protein [Posidoniimonas corsicana]TWT29317.1 hypothetical protein KOR34_52270 [Posidoniimonas corsicana]
MNTPNLLPIGRIAVQIQSPLSDIRRAAAAAGVEPALSLNGVLYFSEVDVEKIDAHLRRRASSPADPMNPPEIL